MAEALSLVPLPVLAAIALAPRGVLRPLLEPDPTLMGLPELVLLVGLVVTWTLAGFLVLRHSRSALAQSMTLLIFTTPATVAAVVWPMVLAAAG